MRGTLGWHQCPQGRRWIAGAGLWGLSLSLALVWPLPEAMAAVQATPAPSALIQPRGPGPYHQLVVPLAWQALSQRDDLGDLRILNAQGQNLPYAWLDSPASPEVEQATRLALFRWREPVAPVGAASAPPPAGPLWVIDVRAVPGTVRRLHLSWPASTTGVFKVAVESSHDMRQWTTLVESVELAALSHQGQVLRQDSIDLGATQARYLRLRLLPGSAEPTFDGVDVITTQVVAMSPAWSWSGPIKPTACRAQGCDYAVPPRVMLGRLKVVLPEPNTLWSLQVQGQGVDPWVSNPSGHRHDHGHLGLRERLRALRHKGRDDDRAPSPSSSPAANWQVLAEGQVHWIERPDAAGRAETLDLPGTRQKALRLSPLGPVDAAWAQQRPVIEVATWTRALVFLARGAPPYRLTLAAPAAQATALSMDQLMPPVAGQRPAIPPVADLQRLAGSGATSAQSGSAAANGTPRPAASVTAPSAADTPASGWLGLASGAGWLWAALLLGLGLMAWMARSLLAQPRASEPPQA